MLSAALKRGSSAPVLGNPSFGAGSGLPVGLSVASATDLALEVYEDEIFDGSEPSSPTAALGPEDDLSPRATSSAAATADPSPAPAAPLARAGAASPASVAAAAAAAAARGGRALAWDVPEPAPPRAASDFAAAAGLARSLPRPISGARLAAAAALAAGGLEEEPFVPPHILATSMVEPQHDLFGARSLSTAKGAAALRVRSSIMARTGFLDGRVGPQPGPLRMPGA